MSNMKKIIILISFFSLVCAQDNKLQVSILDFTGEDVSQKVLKACFQTLETNLIQSGQFVVIEKNAREEILKEQQYLSSGICGDECAVEIGQLLNADVFYIDLMQIKKGKYIIEFRPISKYNTTEEYAKLLEDRIKKQPKHWLWSHDRWKR